MNRKIIRQIATENTQRVNCRKNKFMSEIEYRIVCYIYVIFYYYSEYIPNNSCKQLYS